MLRTIIVNIDPNFGVLTFVCLYTFMTPFWRNVKFLNATVNIVLDSKHK